MGNIAVLGAGPAGMAAAWRLSRVKGTDSGIVVLEKQAKIGGLSKSFERSGLTFDLGSHRLHSACEEDLLSSVGNLPGVDLRCRPRNGRVLLNGRFLKFPPSIVNLLTNCPPGFAIGVLSDNLRANPPAVAKSFRDVMLGSLGKTMCNEFYFPYAEKLWGMSPDEIDPEQARVRVRTSGLTGLARKVAASAFGIGKRNSFYYPTAGIGSICEGMAREAVSGGATIVTGARVTKLVTEAGSIKEVQYEDAAGRNVCLGVDLLLSTIPLPELSAMLDPGEASADTAHLGFRGLLLAYLVFPVDRVTGYDAHYIPGRDFRIIRVSEPGNYTGADISGGCTGLCIEIPCDPDDPLAGMDSEELGGILMEELCRAGIEIPVAPSEVFSRYESEAYPLYGLGFEQFRRSCLEGVESVGGVASFGRCGMFVHDNMHHALAMGISAAECVRSDATWDQNQWQRMKTVFAGFAVED